MIAASAAVRERVYTAEYLLSLPNDVRFELVEGELVPMAPTTGDHGNFTGDLAAEFTVYVRRNGLGRCYAAKTGFLLARDPDVVLAPDFASITMDRAVGLPSYSYLPIAPDMIIETRSPGARPKKVAAKIDRWLSYGVRVPVDADPDRKILTVHRAGAEPQVLGVNGSVAVPELLPGFRLALSEIF